MCEAQDGEQFLQHISGQVVETESESTGGLLTHVNIVILYLQNHYRAHPDLNVLEAVLGLGYAGMAWVVTVASKITPIGLKDRFDVS